MFETPSSLIAQSGQTAVLTVEREGETLMLEIPKVEIDGQSILGIQTQAAFQPVGFLKQYKRLSGHMADGPYDV